MDVNGVNNSNNIIEMAEQDDIISDNNNNIKILYITIAIIVSLLLLWVIVVVITKEDAIKIIKEMNNSSTHIPAAIDKQPDIITNEIRSNIDPVIIPQGYDNNSESYINDNSSQDNNIIQI